MYSGLKTWNCEARNVEKSSMTIMMNDNPMLGVFMHCTVCTVRVS